jgi:hypothetical protein
VPVNMKYYFTSPISRRSIKGAPCGVGFRCLPQPLQKGTPFMTSNIKYIGMDVHKEHADYPIMPTTNRKQRL